MGEFLVWLDFTSQIKRNCSNIAAKDRQDLRTVFLRAINGINSESITALEREKELVVCGNYVPLSNHFPKFD